MKNDYCEKILVVFKGLQILQTPDLSTTPVFSYPFSQRILGLFEKFKGNKNIYACLKNGTLQDTF